MSPARRQGSPTGPSGGRLRRAAGTRAGRHGYGAPPVARRVSRSAGTRGNGSSRPAPGRARSSRAAAPSRRPEVRLESTTRAAGSMQQAAAEQFSSWSRELHHLSVFGQRERHHDVAGDKGEDRGREPGPIDERQRSVGRGSLLARDRRINQPFGHAWMAVAPVHAPLRIGSGPVTTGDGADRNGCPESPPDLLST